MSKSRFFNKAVNLMVKPVKFIRKQASLVERRITGSQKCHACGFTGRFNYGRVLWPELIAEWELSPEWVDRFDLREGQSCPKCYSSLRAGQLSEAIIEALNRMPSLEGISLREIFRQKSIQRLKVAEINSAGTLHPFLAQSPNLCYSEFGSKMPGIADEDLMKLTYDDESFDLVITSETLEHVPDIDVALREIRRILKPDGMHIFTVPLVMDRATTKQRARIENDELIYLSPPSYHGGANEGKSDFLVFYEFGADFISRCERIGFEVVVKKDVSNPALIALITRKN